MKKNKYFLKQSVIGSTFIRKEDIQEIGEFLIEHCNGMSTKQILEEVRNHPRHIINNYIDWNDESASEKYRLTQIRSLIGHIEVKIIIEDNKGEDQEVRIRASHQIKNNGDGSIYLTTQDIFSNVKYRKQILQRALNELLLWKRKYQIYKEFSKIVKIINETSMEVKNGK